MLNHLGATSALLDSPFRMLPEKSSNFADPVDFAFHLTFAICAFFFAIIVLTTIAFVIKYRRKPGDYPNPKLATHNESLELAWTLFPSVLLVVIFWFGTLPFIEMRDLPDDSECIVIKVTAQQFQWSFSYNDGAKTSSDLMLPVNRRIKLVMTSSDVLHSMFIPNFRVKQDVVPKRYTFLWFETNAEEAEYPFYCTEYCGQLHWAMGSLNPEAPAKVKVVSLDKFKEFLTAPEFSADDLTPELWEEYRNGNLEGVTAAFPDLEIPDLLAYGQKLFTAKTCNGCHTANSDVTLIGPGFGGRWGKTLNLVGGSTATFDEEYVRRSILEPNADFTTEFAAQAPDASGMTGAMAGPMRPSERELEALIEYLKTRKAE
ncbi:MAG: cytochrome c oxidase subunit II [Planctomycetes bacterium]|nr:cytochrome c oxidase subunit II [Planctomycetota bacterium]